MKILLTKAWDAKTEIPLIHLIAENEAEEYRLQEFKKELLWARTSFSQSEEAEQEKRFGLKFKIGGKK